MLINTESLTGLSVHAVDGNLGKIDDFLFDDRSWAIRYITVSLHGLLLPKKVLLSPSSLTQISHDAISFKMTRSQIENSPPTDTSPTVSREHEKALHDYYGWPYYWSYPIFYSSMAVPLYPGPPWGVPPGPVLSDTEKTESLGENHLRSSNQLRGYHLQTANGQLGHIDDFIVDETIWAYRYVVIDTRNWLPGKEVLLSPQWINAISWEETKLFTDLTLEKIKNAPPYDSRKPIDRNYEKTLYRYYGKPQYWQER